MDQITLLSRLRKSIPADETACVIPALKRDPLLWAALMEDDLWSSITSRLASGSLQWTPAGIALLALQASPEGEDGVGKPVASASIRRRALQQMQTTLRFCRPPQTLSEAALLALAVLERFHLTGTWDGLVGELIGGINLKPLQALALWRLPLTIAWGLNNYATDLLDYLISSGPSEYAPWVSHMVTTYPIETQQRFDILKDAIAQAAPEYQISLLQALKAEGDLSLASRLAQMLLKSKNCTASLADKIDPAGSPLELSGKITTLQQNAELAQLAGSPLQALALLEKTISLLSTWQTHASILASKAATSGGQHNRSTALIDLVLSSAPAAGDLHGQVLLALEPSAGDKILDQLIVEPWTPAAKLQRARLLYRRGEHALAQEIGRSAFQEWQTSAGELPDDWTPDLYFETLSELGLFEEALNYISHQLKSGVIAPDLIRSAGSLAYQKRHYKLAAELLGLLVLMEPDRVENLRLLASSLEKSGLIEQALENWRTIIKLDPSNLADRLALTACALTAGEHKEALSIAQEMFTSETVAGQAYALAGEALGSLGHPEEAVHALEQGLAIQPDQERAWLALADLYHHAKNTNRQLETLRAGCVAVPSSASIQRMLGDVYSDLNRYSEALPCYRRSIALSPDQPVAYVALIEATRRLGHIDEARACLRQAEQLCPMDPGLAYQRAAVQIMDGDRRAGLDSLKSALSPETAPLRWYLEYAETIFAGEENGTSPDAEDSTSLVNVLDQAMKKFPSEFSLHYWLARALMQLDELEQAGNELENLMELPETNQPEWRWRLLYSLGEAMLLQHQIEISVAMLSEAHRLNPNHMRLQKLLAQAYTQAGLSQEAYGIAEVVRRFSPMDVPTLDWYAGIMENLGRFDEAVDALNLSVQLSPDTPELYLKLSRVHISQRSIGPARHLLSATVACPDISNAELQQAAELYLSLKDAESAYNCLERAAAAGSELPLALSLETTSRFQAQNQIDKAIATLQIAIESAPHLYGLYVYQADLQMEVRNPITALASLQQAAQILSRKTDDDIEPSATLPGWFKGYQAPSGVYYRLGLLLRQSGKLDDALQNLEHAIALQPDRYLYWLAGIELVLALFHGLNHVLVQAVSERLLAEHQWVPDLLEQKLAAAELCAIFAEYHLMNQEPALAEPWIERGLNWLPDSTRLQAARARCLAQAGSVLEAEKTYTALSTGSIVTSIAQLPLSRLYQPEASYRSAFWLGWAAIDCGHWDQGVELLLQNTETFPNEPAAQISLLQCLALAAERDAVSSLLRIKFHTPGPKWNPQNAKALFQRVVASLGKQGRLPEAARWNARGALAFDPCLENVRALGAVATTASDAAALAAGWRTLQKRAEVTQIIRQWIDSPEVLQQGAITLSEWDFGSAITMAQRAVELLPTNPLSHAVWALVSSRAGDHRMTLDALENALALWPNETDWHLWAAEEAESLERLDLVELHLASASALDSASLNILLKRAANLQQIGNYPLAIEILESATRLSPDNDDIWLQMGENWQILNQPENALHCAERAIKQSSASVHALYLAGRAALQLGQSDLAHRYSIQALESDPQNLPAELLLCRSLVALNRHAEALAHLQAIPKECISSSDSAEEYAELMVITRGGAASLALLEELLQVYPDHPALTRLAALALSDANRPADAEHMASKALQLEPDRSDLRLLDGQLLRKAGQLDLAVHQLSEAIRLSPSLLEAYLELGAVYQQQRQYERAFAVYQQAMKIAPNDHRSYYQAGLALREIKDYSGAETLLRKAAQLAPRDLVIRRQLAAIIALNMVTSVQEANICR